MKEIEIKILEINKKEIEKKLVSIGAKKIFQGNMQTTYYDYSNKSLKKQGKLLRIRRTKEKAQLTFKIKKSKNKFKIYEEYEFSIPNPNDMTKIIEELGFIERFTRKKHRTSYSLRKIHFDIDKSPKIPCYMEIESQSKSNVLKYTKILGYTSKDMKTWSESEVLKYYKKMAKK